MCARVDDVEMDITRLLEIRTWRAFDVDDDGRVLAGSDDSGSVQLIELAGELTGGRATSLTALPGACRGRYLPGERAVVVEHDDGGNERGQLSLLSLDLPLGAAAGPATLDDLTPLVHDPRYVHHLLDVLPGRVVYNTNRRNGVDFDIVVRNVATGAEEVIYDHGGWPQRVTVTPDARYVVITLAGSAPMSDELVLVDTMPETEHDRVRRLTEPGAVGRHDRACWLAGRPVFVVASDTGPDSGTDHTSIVGYDVDGGSRWTLITDDRRDLICWPSPDGRLLLVEANDDGVSRLFLHRIADDATIMGEPPREVELPGDGVVAFPIPDPRWSPNSRYLVISYTAPEVPGDVLLLDTASGERPVALTSSADQLAGERMSVPTSHRVPTPDGQRVPCLVYPPTVDRSTVRGSAVLVIHGGPESQSRPIFNPVVQAMAAGGHTVLVPNVRGSTGYGRRWYSADDRRLRLDSVDDLAALHAWLPTLGLDPARAALWGGSYGGYLVLAGLAFQPELWAAGVDIVGMSSLVTFLRNTSPYRRAAREREYGSLEHDLQFLRDASPLTRVDAIRAPLFVIHGANDPRVPLSEAEQLVAAVSAKGVDCELLVYPDEGHGLVKRANRLDAFPQALAFLQRHLEDPAVPPTEPSLAHERTW
jgi:dipeptidyl aminopeptidase/acylaminoacyl peptidase